MAQKPSEHRFNKQTFIPKEYTYPEDSLLTGRTFIFQKEGADELDYEDTQLKITPEGRLLIDKRSYGNGQFDSAVYLNGHIISLFNNIWDAEKLVKGEILEDTVIQNETRLGLHLQRFIYHNSMFDVMVETKEQFKKDTTISWKGQSYPCLVTTTASVIRVQLPTDTAALKTLYSTHTMYFGKGIGLIKFTNNYKGEDFSFALREIRMMDKKKT